MNRIHFAHLLLPILLFLAMQSQAQVTVNTTRQCIGDTVQFSYTTALTLDSVSWDFGDPASGVNNTSKLNTPEHKYLAVNTYTVVLTYYIGGVGTPVNTNVNIYALPTLNIGPSDTTICQGSTLVLDAGAGMAAYSWLSGETTRTKSVNSAGGYKVIVRDANNCFNTDSIHVTTSQPTISLSDANICTNYPTTLDAGAGYESYLWSNSANTQSITVSSPGNYWVEVTDLQGCTGRDTATVNIVAGPTITDAVATPVNNLSAGYIAATASGGTEPYNYSLFSTNGNPLGTSVSGNFADLNKGYYRVVVTDNNGCADTVIVEVPSIKQVVIPRDAFSPNGDNINDTWEIKYIEIFNEAVIRVYDRWQRLVFQSDGVYTPWDGVYNGEVLPMGTYYYYIDQKNGNKPIVGFITLMR